jgi:hypothetical protein
METTVALAGGLNAKEHEGEPGLEENRLQHTYMFIAALREVIA